MNEADVVDLIVDLLAEDAQCDPGQLYAELVQLGDDLPIDSLLAVDILTRVQNATGAFLPATEETARALRSVREFAGAVCRQLDRKGTEMA
ncbi:acyl carrier protein [Nocardia brasiliensis]|uniref:acyl carrier protein n=1 Tax=Nocardia brasiliensis TaxID=37326 RepID=UPI001893A5B0|nr:acyl carrier protein [Nocardia brasiliensis]MBF6127835.1 acyl carrier protein [Nocardia brasiliensis]